MGVVSQLRVVSIGQALISPSSTSRPLVTRQLPGFWPGEGGRDKSVGIEDVGEIYEE